MKKVIDFALFIGMNVKDCMPDRSFATFKLKSGKSVSKEYVKIFEKFNSKIKLDKLLRDVNSEIENEYGLKEE